MGRVADAGCTVSGACVWWWSGGTEVGAWHRADAGTRDAIRRGGHVAHDGTDAIGPPGWPPTRQDFREIDFLFGSVMYPDIGATAITVAIGDGWVTQ